MSRSMQVSVDFRRNAWQIEKIIEKFYAQQKMCV